MRPSPGGRRETRGHAAIATPGEPGQRHQLAAPAAGSASGVEILPDSGIAVALTARDALLLIAADGASREVPLDGVAAPVDVDVLGDELVGAHAVDGAAGGISRRPAPS